MWRDMQLKGPEGAELTLVNHKAQLLDGSQVPADSVDTVHVQAWKHSHNQGAPLTIRGPRSGCHNTSLVNGIHTRLQEAWYCSSLALT